MKSLKILFLILLLGVAVFLFSNAEPVCLIRIPKADSTQWSLLAGLRVDVLQELETCFIARAQRDDFRFLRKNGLRFTVLDKDIQGKEYFLVRAGSREKLPVLQARGRLIEVEGGTLIGWTMREDPSSLIPSDVARKPLPTGPILSFLRRPSPRLAVQEFHAVKDSLVQFIVDHVSKDNLRGLVQSLQAFQTRFSSTPNCEAAGEFIFNYFQSMGLEPSYEPFEFEGAYSSRNVIVDKRGETDPGKILIICAHYDSTSNIPTTLAPGADDDASGVAAVMEAARILRPYSFDFTVRFIAFSAEEWGLYGSRNYAAQARDRDDEIIGVINLDMIAYANLMPEDLELFVNSNSEWLGERFRLAAGSYSGLRANLIVDASMVYSDHAPFWDTGYPALLSIEDSPLTNPYYHQTTDTAATLNFDFFTAATKAALGTAAELAQPLKAGYPKSPTRLAAQTYGYSSLFNPIRTVYLSWTASQDASGYNIYRSSASHLNYQKVNSSPVQSTAFMNTVLDADTFYYYVVTAVGGGGLESNYSGEVEIEPIPVSSGRKISQDSSSLERRGQR